MIWPFSSSKNKRALDDDGEEGGAGDNDDYRRKNSSNVSASGGIKRRRIMVQLQQPSAQPLTPDSQNDEETSETTQPHDEDEELGEEEAGGPRDDDDDKAGDYDGDQEQQHGGGEGLEGGDEHHYQHHNNRHIHQQQQQSTAPIYVTSSQFSPTSSSFIQTLVDRLMISERCKSAVEILTRNGGTNFVNLLVDSLLISLEEAESAVDILNQMNLADEANHKARSEFDTSKLCEYLVRAMKANMASHNAAAAMAAASASVAAAAAAATNNSSDDGSTTTTTLHDAAAANANVADVVMMQAKCCDLITALTYSHDANKAALHKAGVCAVIVQSMNDYPDHAELQQCGCSALYNLLKLQTHQENVVFCGGIEAMIEAMKRHPFNESVQRDACNSLKALAHYCENNQKRIIDQGGVVEIALAQKRAHGTGSKVEGAATKALKALCGPQQHSQHQHQLQPNGNSSQKQQC